MTGFENVGVFIREKVWLGLFSSQTFSNLVILHAMKMEQCSETSAYKIQTPSNYPEEGIQQHKYLF